MRFNVGTALNTYDFFSTVRTRRIERPDESFLASLTKGGIRWGAREIAYKSPLAPFMWAGTMASLGTTVGEIGYRSYLQGPTKQGYNPKLGGGYVDTEVAATMRQRGVAAIQQSRLTAHSVLGNEARSIHNSRSYYGR